MTTTVDKSIAAILSDIKEELNDFIRTRIELFKDEFQEKLKCLKVAAPLVGVGFTTRNSLSADHSRSCRRCGSTFCAAFESKKRRIEASLKAA
jgi:hypothetical protein